MLLMPRFKFAWLTCNCYLVLSLIVQKSKRNQERKIEYLKTAFALKQMFDVPIIIKCAVHVTFPRNKQNNYLHDMTTH